jgi:methylglutaconyl-CoA hydratase
LYDNLAVGTISQNQGKETAMQPQTLTTPLHLELDPERPIATLILNRPDVHNAFDDMLVNQLSKTLKQLQQDNSIQLLILKGAGDHFSAGADLNWMRRMVKHSVLENQEDALALADLMHALYHFPKPTLAMIQGSVFGGAIGLVACCDIALACDDVAFGLTETKLGLIPAVIAPYVIRAIGARAAKRYMLSAERFNAQDALQLGLIHECHPKHTLESRLSYFIDLLLNNSADALLKTKAMVNTLSDHTFQDEQATIDYTAQLIAEIRTTPEAQSRLTTFLEKREGS